MNIDFIDLQTDLLIIPQQVCSLVQAVLSFEGVACDEVAVHYVDTARISTLHAQFFNDPSPTDCITFPVDESTAFVGYRMLGDIFVCPKTALDYVAEHGGDPYDEVSLYTVHALLHLLGYDDLEEHACLEMRAAEQRHMKHLKQIGCCLHK